MLRHFRHLIVFAFVLSTALSAHAIEEGEISLGASAGNVNLVGDPGAEYGNAIGFGGIFNYAATDDMLFELGYYTSTHGDLNRRAVDVGINYYTGSLDALLYNLSGGASFVNHAFTLEGRNFSSDAFNLYAGGGGDFAVGERFTTGIQLRYYKAFGTTVDVDGEDFKAVEDSIAVYLRVLVTL